MITIFDLDKYPFSIKNGSYGGVAGSKDGLSIEGENWLIKYPKSLSQMDGMNASYSTAPLSEFLGSHIYKILGYNVHETILGERNNKIVVGCKDFENGNKRLLEIRTLKNHTNNIIDELISEEHLSSSVTHVVDIEEIQIHIENNDLLKHIPGIKQRFFDQIIVDIFINNNDRNNGNWGVIREEGKEDILAPIYDNGGSFSNKMSEEKIGKLLVSPELINHATNVLTVYSKKGNQLNAKKLIKEIENIPEFQDALRRTVPVIISKYDEISAMIDQIPCEHVLKNGNKVYIFSEKRKELYKKELKIRTDKIFIPLYEKIKIAQNTNPHSLLPSMEAAREEFFSRPSEDRKYIHWNNEDMRIAKFEDLYLAQCEKEGVVPNKKIYGHFWKNCVAQNEYKPKYCKEIKGFGTREEDIH